MLSRVQRVVDRAKFAAIGGAIGGGAGGLIGRNTASTGAAAGALVGAAVGEKRATVDSIVKRVRDRTDREALTPEAAE